MKPFLRISLLIFVSLILVRIFGFLFNSALTKTITQSEYGTYIFMWSTAQMLTGVVLLGMSAATGYYVAFHRGRGQDSVARDVTSTGLVAVVVLVFLSVIVFFGVNYFYPDLLSLDSRMFIVFAMMFVVHAIGSFFNSVINGYKRPDIGSMIAVTLPLVGVVGVIMVGNGFYNVLLAVLLAMIVNTGLNAWYVVKKFGIGKVDLARVKGLVEFGLPCVGSDVALNLSSMAGVFFLKFYGSFSDVALFSASNAIAGMLLVVPHMFLSLFYSTTTEKFASKNTKEIEKYTSYFIERLIMICLPILAVILVFAEGILKVVYTEEYGFGLPIRLLAVSMFFMAIYQFFTALIMASGSPKSNMKTMMVGAVVNVGLSFLLVGRFGVVGSSVAVMISSFVVLVISFLMMRRVAKVIIHKDFMIKVSVTIGVTISLLYATKGTDIVMSFFMGGLILVTVYPMLLWMMKAVNGGDIKMIKDKFL